MCPHLEDDGGSRFHLQDPRIPQRVKGRVGVVSEGGGVQDQQRGDLDTNTSLGHVYDPPSRPDGPSRTLDSPGQR